jgi:GNAT superfamily N-acetyltransferase
MPRLPEAVVRYLIDIDHRDHEAMIALDEEGTEALGVARYVRDPARPETAEVAVTVVDDWQGRGLGTLLLEAISARARAAGIRTFTAWMLARNQEMMDLFRHLGPVRVVEREAGTIEIEVATPAAGVAPELRELLRLSAEHDVAVPVTRREDRQTSR